MVMANRWWWVLMCEFDGKWAGLWMGSDGWVRGGWVGGSSRWVSGMRLLGLCFLFLFLFICGGGFGVLLWWFWCETVVGWDVGC